MQHKQLFILGMSMTTIFANITPIYAQEQPPQMPEGSNFGGGGQTDASNIEYTAIKDVTSDTTLKNQSLNSTGTDENVIHNSNGATTTISKSTITQSSDTSTGGDNSSFYGVGAAILNTEGTLYVNKSNITTDAKGGAGIFSYGDATTYVSNTKINTSKDTSGGIHVAGGGTLYAWNLKVKTAGESSAAIRSDRGGGTMVVNKGTYTTTGIGSPAIYSTANIAVKDATLTAKNSEATCIEGDNQIYLYNCNLTGNMPENEQNDCTWNVILYQSMSGDSEEGNSTFQMVGGTLTAKNGGMFYTTNTQSTFTLKNVNIKYSDSNDYFLKCTGNSNQRGWGQTGENGANCTFTAIKQKMKSDIVWDSISTLDMYVTKSSKLTGAIINDESNAGNGGSGYANVTIDKNSTWIVTGDSTLTTLNNAGTIKDKKGNTVTIQGSDGTIYVKGTSQYTITVNNYSTSTDTSNATSVTSWSTFKQTKPTELK